MVITLGSKESRHEPLGNILYPNQDLAPSLSPTSTPEGPSASSRLWWTSVERLSSLPSSLPSTSAVCVKTVVHLSPICGQQEPVKPLGPAGRLHQLQGSLVTAADSARLWRCESSHRKLVRKWAWLSAKDIMDKASQMVTSGPRAILFHLLVAEGFVGRLG